MINELETLKEQLKASVKMLRDNGIALANAEREYKVALRKRCLELRAKEMPIGMIDKVVYGEPDIAEMRFKRDCAEVVYQANQEAILSIKLQLRLCDNQIEREWTTSE